MGSILPDSEEARQHQRALDGSGAIAPEGMLNHNHNLSIAYTLVVDIVELFQVRCCMTYS
jgi:hypothetical protein